MMGGDAGRRQGSSKEALMKKKAKKAEKVPKKSK